MNWNSSFIWKLVYGGLIVALLVPLYLLGQPATSATGPGAAGGGTLAQLRGEYGLSQASLGEIDPASESMKLATLGLRGVAANILWGKATDYKRKEDWDNLSATLNQITKLQPNFISVWEFQGHNLSYNVSAEFDDYRHRYHWVKKGIDFLTVGTEYNSKEPRLPHTVGWYLGHKIGRADEYRQFRRLFREDRDYHRELARFVEIDSPEARRRHDQYPDNWLVSRLWYIKAQTLVDTLDRPLRGKSPLIFHADRPKALMSYAAAIEEEGLFGEVAKAAWTEGLTEWVQYGNRPIPSSWGVNFALNEYEAAVKKVQRLEKDLAVLTPGVKQRIRDERLATLSDEERAVYVETPEEMENRHFTEKELTLHYKVQQIMKISDAEIAENAPSEQREKSRRLVRKLNDARTLMDRIGRYREQVNYDYWRTRCEAEQTDTAANARENMYLAEKYLDDAMLEDARKHFDLAWDLWYELFEQFPALKSDLSSEDLEQPAKLYMVMLGQLGEDIAPDFKLRWLLEEAAYNSGQMRGSDYPPGSPEAAANPADAPPGSGE